MYVYSDIVCLYFICFFFLVCFIFIYNKVCEEERECIYILIIVRIMWLVNVLINFVVYFIYLRKIWLFLVFLFKKFVKRRSVIGRELISMNNFKILVILIKL